MTDMFTTTTRAALACCICLFATTLAAPGAHATEGADGTAISFTPAADLFTRYELRRNYAPDVGADRIAYRTRFGAHSSTLQLTPCIGASVHFQLQAAGYWNVGGDTLVDASLGLHEGYLRVNFGDELSLQIGRMELVYGDHLVMGNVGWHPVGRSYDAARLRWQREGTGYIDVFGALLHEREFLATERLTNPNAFPGDLYLVGLYAGIGEAIKHGWDLDLYLLTRIAPDLNDRGAGGVPTRPAVANLTAGVRFKGSAGIFDWRFEGGIQAGRTIEIVPTEAFAFHDEVELGLTTNSGNFRGALGVFYASGDDPDTADRNEAWDQLYPTAHKFMGQMDIIGARSNVYGSMLRLRGKPCEHLALSLDAMPFFTEESFVDPATGDDQNFLGVEVDAGALWTFAPKLRLRAGYGFFIFDDAISSDVAHFFELEFGFRL